MHVPTKRTHSHSHKHAWDHSTICWLVRSTQHPATRKFKLWTMRWLCRYFRDSHASCSIHTAHSLAPQSADTLHAVCDSRVAQATQLCSLYHTDGWHTMHGWYRQYVFIQTSATLLFLSQLARESRSDNTFPKSSRARNSWTISSTHKNNAEVQDRWAKIVVFLENKQE